MKNLLLIFALFIGLFSQAQQQSVLTLSQVAHDGETYTHIKGDDNEADNCFVATSSSTLSMSVDGLAVDNIYYDNVPYKWVRRGTEAEALVLSFNSWNTYDRFYRNRGDARPIRDEAVIALEEALRGCTGWSLDSSGQWHTNPAFRGYAYNSVISTDGTIHAPQLVINYDGTTPDLRRIADGGQSIYVGSFPTNELAVEAVEAAIREHMDPTTPETGASTPTTAVNQWNQGTIQGFVGYGERSAQSWENDIYPGYAYNTWENRHIDAEEWFIRVGVLESGSWTNMDIPGRHDSEAEADRIARAYIASRFANLDYVDGGNYRHSVFPEGPGVFFTIVYTLDDEVVSIERYATFSEANAAGRAYSPTTVAETPTSSTSGLCSASDLIQNPVGFFADNYITSSITENGVSRFDYVTANTAYEYRDLNRTNPWNRFGIYPPVIVIAGSQVKVISHRSAEEIQPSDVLATVAMTDDCSILDAFIATAVTSYRNAFDAMVPAVNLPAPTADHSWYNHGSFSSDWTSPRFPGWRYSFQGLTSGIRLTVTNHAGRNFLLRTYTREAGESNEDFYGRMHTAARRVVVGQDTSFVNEWRYSYRTGYNPTYIGYSYRVSGSNGSYVARIYRDNNLIFSYNSASVDGARTGAQEHIENLYVN